MAWNEERDEYHNVLRGGRGGAGWAGWVDRVGWLIRREESQLS